MNPLISPARSYPALRSGGGSIEFGITPLVPGQAHIDVVLTTSLSSTIWDTVCSVVNTDDPAPLNIWPCMITAKSTTGFTVQLNGMPDSANYFLHWTIIPGASAPAVIATTYVYSGPTSGATAVASAPFTVHLLSGQTVPAPVTVTPHDGGGGGTFTPSTVSLTTAAPSATFTYTPGSTGAKTISVTNGGGLTDPASLTYTATATNHLLNTLISYWKLDEASGTRNDSKGTNHLADHGVTSSAGVIANAAVFTNTVGVYLDIPSNATLQVTGDFTFSIWIKPTIPADTVLISKNNGTTNEYLLLSSDASGTGITFYAGSAAPAQVGSIPTLGAWLHIVAWFDSSDGKGRIRINDATTYVGASAGTLSTTAANFTVGAGTGGGGSIFGGLIDEVGFWKRKLTAGEITQLYNGGAGFPFGSFLP
jgi:hypothetical protein